MTNLTELTTQELKDLVKEVETTFVTMNLTDGQAETQGQLRKEAKEELASRTTEFKVL